MMRSSLIESRPAPNANNFYPRPFPGSQQPLPSSRKRSRRSFPLAPGEGWLPLILLAVAVYSVVYSVTAAITIEHSNILMITTALGLLCGLLVAKSRNFSQAVLHVGACILGYWLAIFATGLLAYHVSVLTILASLRSVIANGFALSGAQDSTMVFLFYLAFLCFFLGYFGSWLIYRAHLPWLVALVYVAIMIVNLNYISKRDLTFLMVLLAGSLILLIARVQLANQLIQWKNEGLYTDKTWLRSLTSRFLRVSAIFALLILPLSWLLPVAGEPAPGVAFWNSLDNAWANLTHGNLSALSNPGSLFSPYDPPTNFFGDQLTITGSVNLPNGPVLSYLTASSSQGVYLEGFTFDTFDGHTWTAQAAASSQSYEASAQLPLDSGNVSYNALTTTVTIIQPPEGTKHYIFAPAQPGSFTVPVTVFTDITGSITSAWTQTTALRPDERYQVTSEVSTTSLSDLENVPFLKDDPASWTTDPNYRALQHYYLQKPGNLSPEVLATALNWTNGSHNVYDALLALQNHLNDSKNFTYSVSNPPVPQNIDAVTWLLHTHRGYCTYYATAMTVMARLLGIPARVVSGFSQGHYDAQQRAWVVDGSDAHSWVQAYLPGAGWVNFDPTPGFSLNGTTAPTVTPAPTKTTPPASGHLTPTPQKGQAGAQPTSTTPRNGTPFAGSGDVQAVQNLFLAFSLLFLLFSCVVLGLALVRYRSNRAPLAPVASIYARLCRLAALIGSPPASWQTPYEYTFVLSRRFPQASTALRRLADLFVRERWASPQHLPAPRETQELQRLWPRLRNTILRAPFSKRH
jgi:transglutaminase-like putative cysteine protease